MHLPKIECIISLPQGHSEQQLLPCCRSDSRWLQGTAFSV